MTNEIWKDIEGYEGKYQVSTKGNVMCIKRSYRDRSGRLYYKSCNKHLKGNINTNGYPSVRLFGINGKSKYVVIHSLVANAFIENPENKKCVDHINRDKTDNRVENLRWATNSENMRNRKDNVLISYKGVSKTATEWSDQTGIKLATILSRYRKGWSSTEILEIPLCKNGIESNFFKNLYKNQESEV